MTDGYNITLWQEEILFKILSPVYIPLKRFEDFVQQNNKLLQTRTRQTRRCVLYTKLLFQV